MRRTQCNPDETFQVGDIVSLICTDGKPFSGVLTGFDADYLLVNGYGFPLDGIAVMVHG